MPHVLIVEDDLMGALALRRLLELCDIRVDMVSTVEAALGALGRQPYDAIVCDLLLDGGVSGLELARRLRRTRLVAISGHSVGIDKAQLFDVRLRKPCDPDLLLQAILGTAE